MMALKVFVIGYRNHALKVIKHLIKNKLCDKIFVYHPEKNKLKDIENISKLVFKTNDLEWAMRCSCVFICSPSNSHVYYLKELSRMSIEHRRLPYIYCEKPVAVNSSEVNWLKKKFSSFSTRLQVGFNLLNSDFVLEASKLITRKNLGKPISAFFQVSHGLASKHDFSSNWRAQDTNPFSQLLGNLAIHHIHASQHLFGKVKNFLLTEQNAFDKKNPDSLSLLLDHESGVQSHIFCSYATVFSKRFSIYLTDGLLEHSHEGLVLMSPRDTYNDAGQFTSPPKMILNEQGIERDKSLYLSITKFLQDVRSGKDLNPAGLKSALEASELVIEITSKTFHPSRK